MNLTARSFACALGASLLAGLTAVSAQTPAPAPSNEEVVQLEEFNVAASADRGYVASETLTGTRVRTQIVDLPYTVNVLTSEFFEDFAMFELGENVTQIGSFTGLDIGGGFNLRGFSSTSQLRDGFYRLGRYGSSNIDRMEIIKGSNAAIYGRTSPGGMLNFISKQPRDRRHYKAQLSYGDFDQRGLIEATGPVYNGSLGKTTYILTASSYQKDFDIEYSRRRNQEYYLALKHTFNDKSTLMLSAEYFLQIQHAPVPQAPVVTDQKNTASNTDDEVIGYARNLVHYNPYGPNSELNRSNVSLTATYEKRLNEVWTLRSAGNYYRARRWEYNQNTGFGGVTINSTTAANNLTSTRGATPTKGYIMEDGGGIQADLLAHKWLANKTVETRTLATLDFNDYYRWDPTWNYAASTTANPDLAAWNAPTSGRIVSLNPDFSPSAPLTYFPNWWKWGNESINRLTRRRTTVLGGLLREQAGFMNGRLLAFAGARYDMVRFQERDFLGTIGESGRRYAPGAAITEAPGARIWVPGEMISRRVNELTPSVGVNYKLTPEFRLFANYSESYFVNQTDNPEAFASNTYKPELANGYDYGFKGSMLQDRVNFTVSGFYAIRQNVSVTQVVEISPGNFQTTNVRDGDHLVRGVEADLNWRISPDLSFNGSWGHVYSIYTDFGAGKPLSKYRRVQNIAPDNGGLTLKYAPTSGRAKGFSANVQWTYVAATPTEAPDAGDTYAVNSATGAVTLTRTTNQWKLKSDSYGLWNAGVRYKLNTGRYGHTFAVNVNNALDKEYLNAGRRWGEPRSVIFTYTLDL